MRVLFVYPNLHGMNMIPPAIGLLTAVLKQHGHEVDLFDTTNWIFPEEKLFDSDKSKEMILNVRPYDSSKLKENLNTTDVYDDFEKKVKEYSPGLVAVSVSEEMFFRGINLLKKIRHLNIPSIMGGVFPTFSPEMCLSYDEVDMVCIGDGEGALVELCKRMDERQSLENVANLGMKTKNGIKINPLRELEDISNNPLPDLSLFDETRLYRPMVGKVLKMPPAETHRGCPYQCAYCNSPSQRKLYKNQSNSNYFRKKTIDALSRELKFYKNEVKADAIYFWADTFFSYSKRERSEFLEMYQDIKLPFWCQGRVEEIPDEDELLQFMDAGLFRMGFGVEHGNEDFRINVLKRKVKNATIIENIQKLKNCNLSFSVNNIIGFPTETRKLAMDTVELNRHIPSDSANAYTYSPFHGTPLREMAEELGYIDKGLIASSLSKMSLLNMPQFPPEAIEGLRRCFVLHVKMPKQRSKDIEKAEKLTPEGDCIWHELRQECIEKYMDY